MNSHDIILSNMAANIFGPKTAAVKNKLAQQYQLIGEQGLGHISPDGTKVTYHDIVHGQMTVQSKPTKSHG